MAGPAPAGLVDGPGTRPRRPGPAAARLTGTAAPVASESDSWDPSHRGWHDARGAAAPTRGPSETAQADIEPRSESCQDLPVARGKSGPTAADKPVRAGARVSEGRRAGAGPSPSRELDRGRNRGISGLSLWRWLVMLLDSDPASSEHK